MGIMDMRVIITVVSFVVFILIVFWAYNGRQKKRFDEAANLPFADDEMQQRTVDKLQSANGSANGKVSADRKSADQSVVRATADKGEPRG